ncbi:MAG: GAF domain-containing protein [Armatimonadetes bacterium]|nr:GAF domain-containing protein [Armatimonadota bacterium]
MKDSSNSTKATAEGNIIGICEKAGRVAKREHDLWVLAVLTILGLSLAVNVLDFLLWMERRSMYGLSSIDWTPAIIRMSLPLIVGISAIYFSRVATNLINVNRTLIENLNIQTRLLADKNSQLARLKELSEELISQVDLKPALDLALEMVIDVIGARTASIMLLDPDTQEMTIAAARGLPKKIIRETRVKAGEGLAGLVVSEGEAVVINSDDLDERFAPLAKRTSEVKSAIIAPIKIDGKVRGVINVSDKKNVDRWSAEDLDLVSTLAGQAALVLQKIQLYEHLQEQVAVLRETLDQLQKTQAELIQSEKLASIGQLAGGVAHEINNPLLVILGRAELALEKLQHENPMRKDLEIIQSQTERIAEIVRNLLRFSRTSKVDDFGAVAINDVIENTLALTESQMAKGNISVLRKLDLDLPLVWGNPGHLQQVFVNLTINAHQAMAEKGGTLTVLTRTSRGKLFVQFRDTGPGIQPEDREKIFEPFFTTKDETEGTGLGLAITSGIIHAHGGKIEAGGDPGKGAVFTIELPVMQTEQSAKEVGGREQDTGCGRRERNTRAVS